LSRVAQAGAIAFKVADDTVHILIVRAKKTPTDWIFPKGHIEAGETAEAAAIRELEEEAGCTGESLGSLGSLEFQSGKELVTVEYFLIKFTHDVPRKEKREIRWCEYEEALALLSHPDAAKLLKNAKIFIDKESA
jgi:8-oxo-dGTP pyrophosphatase MutT (NUDIX family)